MDRLGMERLGMEGLGMERLGMERLGIEPLSVAGLSPVGLVNLAGDLGLQYIAIALTSMPNRKGYPHFSLRSDRGLRRETIAALRARGVAVALGDGFVVREGVDMRQRAADFEIMAELGAQRVNTLSSDPDMNRSIDQFGVVAELAAGAGMSTTLELVPTWTIGDLPTAVAAVRQVGRADFRLLLDTMHVVRSGSGPEEVRALDPDLIGHVQLADAPLIPTITDYMEEAVFERMVPGTGQLPLLDLLAAVPRHVVVGLEVPLRSEAEAGVGPYARMARCVDAARKLLAQLDPN